MRDFQAAARSSDKASWPQPPLSKTEFRQLKVCAHQSDSTDGTARRVHRGTAESDEAGSGAEECMFDLERP